MCSAECVQRPAPGTINSIILMTLDFFGPHCTLYIVVVDLTYLIIRYPVIEHSYSFGRANPNKINQSIKYLTDVLKMTSPPYCTVCWFRTLRAHARHQEYKEYTDNDCTLENMCRPTSSHLHTRGRAAERFLYYSHVQC